MIAPVAVAGRGFDIDGLIHELEHDVIHALNARSVGNGLPKGDQSLLFCYAGIMSAVVGRVNRPRRAQYQVHAARAEMGSKRNDKVLDPTVELARANEAILARPS